MIILMTLDYETEQQLTIKPSVKGKNIWHIHKIIYKIFNQCVNPSYTIPHLPQMPKGGPLASAPLLQRRGRLLQMSQMRNGLNRPSLHLCWQGDKREDISKHWINTAAAFENSLWTISERKGRGSPQPPYTVNKDVMPFSACWHLFPWDCSAKSEIHNNKNYQVKDQGAL